MHGLLTVEGSGLAMRGRVDTQDRPGAEPDLTFWSWKDEHEYAHGRRLGLVGEDLHTLVEQGRQRALGLLRDRSGPFADPWTACTPTGPGCCPVLPDGADGTAAH